MCKAKKSAKTQTAPTEPIQEQTPADAQATKAVAIEREKQTSLAGRDSKTGARGLADEVKNKRKTLLGE